MWLCLGQRWRTPKRIERTEKSATNMFKVTSTCNLCVHMDIFMLFFLDLTLLSQKAPSRPYCNHYVDMGICINPNILFGAFYMSICLYARPYTHTLRISPKLRPFMQFKIAIDFQSIFSYRFCFYRNGFGKHRVGVWICGI